MCMPSSARAQSAVVAPAAKHMLFRATGPNGATVYLLGSVHLLSEAAGKLPAIVDSAFARAHVVAFETSLDTLEMRAPELLAKARYPAGTTLQSSLSPRGAAKLDTVLRAYGLTVQQVNGYKPWFVSLLMTQLVLQRMHFQPQFGVDVQLNTRAHAAAKRMIGLESADVQLGLFDRLSAEDQEHMVLMGGAPDSAAHEMERIKDAWLSGDAAALDSMSRASSGSTGLQDILVNQRNANWLPTIDALLRGREDALVVVGAAHLVGRRGVVELLRAKGYRVEQL
jgi:uncharacterized protein YbaP (TraB family)